MAQDINTIILLGRVGIEPDIRTVNGTSVATVSLATARTWKDDKGERKEATTWHRVICWGGLADVVEKYVSKGDTIAIQGRQDNRSWEDKNGDTRYSSEVVADSVHLVKTSGKRSDADDSDDRRDTRKSDRDGDKDRNRGGRRR